MALFRHAVLSNLVQLRVKAVPQRTLRAEFVEQRLGPLEQIRVFGGRLPEESTKATLDFGFGKQEYAPMQ